MPLPPDEVGEGLSRLHEMLGMVDTRPEWMR